VLTRAAHLLASTKSAAVLDVLHRWVAGGRGWRSASWPAAAPTKGVAARLCEIGKPADLVHLLFGPFETEFAPACAEPGDQLFAAIVRDYRAVVDSCFPRRCEGIPPNHAISGFLTSRSLHREYSKAPRGVHRAKNWVICVRQPAQPTQLPAAQSRRYACLRAFNAQEIAHAV